MSEQKDLIERARAALERWSKDATPTPWFVSTKVQTGERAFGSEPRQQALNWQPSRNDETLIIAMTHPLLRDTLDQMLASALHRFGEESGVVFVAQAVKLAEAIIKIDAHTPRW